VLGAEVGLADRFGMGTSVEVWAGPKVIYTGLVLFDSVRIAPGLTFGLSAVTKPVGIEATRQAAVGGNATLLGYLGPELATSFLRFFPIWNSCTGSSTAPARTVSSAKCGKAPTPMFLACVTVSDQSRRSPAAALAAPSRGTGLVASF
jgi:hypothetical protein